MKSYYLVELDLSADSSELIVEYMDSMNSWLAEGKIQSLAVAEDLTRCWVVLIAETEFEAWDLIGKLPSESIYEPLVTPLMSFHQSVDLQFPAICWN